MLSLLLLFNFFILNLYQTAAIICITKTYQRNLIFYSLLSKDIFCLYKTLYFSFSVFCFNWIYLIYKSALSKNQIDIEKNVVIYL